jgi:hypothetical protein
MGGPVVKAKVGGEVVVKGHRVGEPDGDTEVLEIRGEGSGGQPTDTDTRERSVVAATGRGPRHRRRLIGGGVGVVALVAASVGAVLAARDAGDRSATTPPPTESQATAPPAPDADAGGAASTEPPTTAAPTTMAPVELVLEDGRHPVYLTAIDLGGRTVEFDLIRFLTGDDAVVAWDADHPDTPGGPPNDYYIVNDNARLRTLPVAEQVAVTVLDWNAGFTPTTVAFADLPTELADGPISYETRLRGNPFWLTVEDDTVIVMEEQYTP